VTHETFPHIDLLLIHDLILKLYVFINLKRF